MFGSVSARCRSGRRCGLAGGRQVQVKAASMPGKRVTRATNRLGYWNRKPCPESG